MMVKVEDRGGGLCIVLSFAVPLLFTREWLLFAVSTFRKLVHESRFSLLATKRVVCGSGK